MKIKGIVSYNGHNFGGWQKQPFDSSIQEEIESSLSTILNKKTKIYGSGRTDAGVHALGQVFHFVTDKEDLDIDKLKYSLNRMITPYIRIKSLEVVSDDFDARLSAKEKHYRYLIEEGFDSPFNVGLVYHSYVSLDIDKIIKASRCLIGTMNYQNFTAKEEDEALFIRTISALDIARNGAIISIDIKGDGFMRYMVRMIVGALLAIGEGKEDISYIENKLKETPRNNTSYKAISDGLYLVEVKY